MWVIDLNLVHFFKIMTGKMLSLCFPKNLTLLCYVIPGYWLSRISVIRLWIFLKRYLLLDLNSFRPWYWKYSRQCSDEFTTTHSIWRINIERAPYPLYMYLVWVKMWHSCVNGLKLKTIAWKLVHVYLFQESYDTILFMVNWWHLLRCHSRWTDFYFYIEKD